MAGTLDRTSQFDVELNMAVAKDEIVDIWMLLDTIVGEVPDAHRFIADKQVNVVPLLSGSGIRVKIIEAMSMGKAVVTTTVGAQGINYTDGENLLIADTPEQFAHHIGRLVADGDLCRRVGEAAARLVAAEYDERVLSQRLIKFYEEIIKR